MVKIIMILLCFFFSVSKAQIGEEVGVTEKLGETVPLDIVLTNSLGEKKTLKEILDKPTVLSLVYYKCPGICNVLLAGLRDVVERSELEPGKDYNLLSVSFAPGETAELAMDKKKNYLVGMNREFSPDSWAWTVADSVDLHRLTEAVGFKYKIEELNEDAIDYLHSAGLIFLSSDGKITRYLPGTDFMPFNFKMAVVKAAKGEEAPTLEKMIALCFKAAPDGRGYVLNVTRIMGVVMLLSLGIFILWLVFAKKKNSGANK